MTTFDDLKLAIETLSGCTNTVKLDDLGIASIQQKGNLYPLTRIVVSYGSDGKLSVKKGGNYESKRRDYDREN